MIASKIIFSNSKKPLRFLLFSIFVLLVSQIGASALQADVITSNHIPASCVGVTFTRNLTLGVTGQDVVCLQAILNLSTSTQVSTTGPGSLGHETSLFWTKTLAAVRIWQSQQGFTPAQQVGPLSRAKLNAFLSTSPITQSSNSGYYFVGGTINGIIGTTVLENNHGDDLTIYPGQSSVFTFATPVANGSAFSVTIATEPSNQTCYFQRNQGAVLGANVTTVAIRCQTSTLSYNPFNFILPGGGVTTTPGIVPSDATLSNLSISSGTLSPSFSSATTSYTASVSNTVAIITVTPTHNQANATITVNGSSVTSGSPSASLPLNVGSNTITIVVTAQDTSTDTYIITVTRVPSTNTSITSFNFNALSPAVTGTVDNTGHTVLLTVPYGTTVTSLVPTIILATGATISPTSGTAQDFTNPVTYTVTAQDGTTTQNYTVTVSTFTYYVDSVNGSDSNSGLSAATAFKTLAAATTAIGSGTNMSLGLAKGSTWKEQLMISNNNNGITVASYGSGAMPLIDGSDTIPSGNFSLVGGDTYTYQASVTFTGHTNSDGSPEQRLVWENNVNLVQVTSIANVESTAGSFYYSNYTNSSATVYIHASDGSNPGTSGKTYDYTNRYYGIQITGNNCLLDGIRTRRQRDANGSIEIFGTGCTIQNGEADDGNKHAAYMYDGTVNNYTFRNVYNGTTGSPNFLVFNQNTPSGDNLLVENSTFIDDPTVVPSSGGIVTPVGSGASGVISHHNTSGSFGTFTGTNNTFNQTVGYGLNNVGNENISGDTFTNCSSVGSTADATTVSISSITVTNPLSVSTSFSLFSSNNPVSGRISVTYTGITVNSGTDVIRVSGNNLDSIFTNSSLTAGDTSSRSPQGLLRITGTGGTLTVNGTTLTQTVAGQTFYNLASDTTYVGNDNTFVRPSGAWNWRSNSTVVATTLSGWQTYSGQDANSTAQ